MLMPGSCAPPRDKSTSPRSNRLPVAGRASLAPAMTGYGARSMTSPLRRVLVRPPHPADVERWREYGWRAEPDLAAAAAEHEALREILAGAGAEVIVAEGERGNPDAIYAYDPVL